MLPYLFEWGDFKLGTYGLMMALGFLVNGWLLSREFARRGISRDVAWEIVLGASLGGVLCARLLSVLETWDQLGDDFWGTVLFNGGLTWYGGFLGGAIGVIIVLKLRKISVVEVCDATAALLMLGYAFGRGGCQISGDGCYGIPTDSALGMAYPNGIVPVHHAVHPTPLYEIVYSVIGFALVWFWLRKKELPKGALFCVFLLYSSLWRFLVEFIRRNERYWLSFEDGLGLKKWYWNPHEGGFHGFSLSQWVSIALFIWGLLWTISLLREKNDAADAVNADDAADTATA